MLSYSLVPAKPAATHWCLVLHGLGDSRQGWMPVVPMLGVPGIGYALADAPRKYGDGFSWFDIHQDFSIDDAQVRESRAALAELIRHLLERLGIASDRLFLMGFSQGCLMAIDAALRWPTPFAGVVGISGFMAMLVEYPAGFGAAAKDQRLLLTHGRQDPMIPLAFVGGQKDRLRKLGIHVDWREYDKVHTLDPSDELDDIRAFLRERMQANPARPAPG